MKGKQVAYLLMLWFTVPAQLCTGAPEGESSEPLFPTEIDLSIGYQDIGLYGNPSKFEQYVVPPEQLFFDNLSVRGQQRKEDDPFFFLNANRLGEDAYWVEGSVYAVKPALSLRAGGSRYRFFPEPAPLASQPGLGERTVQDFSLQWSPLNGIQQVKIYRQIQDVAKPALAGYSPVDYDSDRLGADLSFVISDPVAKLHLPVTASFYKENFAPGSGMALPNSEETLLQLGLTALDTEQLCVDIGYARERIEQEFVAGESSSNSLRIGALLYPLPGLVGRLAVNRTDIDQALTINGYAESFDTTALELSYRYGRLSLRGGLDYREVDHVSSTAAFANNSKRRRLFLQGKQKLGAHITAMVRYEQDDISDPPSADSLISPLPLYYDETRKVIGKVDAALTNDLFLYGSLEKSRSENEARGSRLDLDGWGVGGYWQISNRLGASADYSRQKFDGFATDPVIAPWNALAPWMPDSRVATVSAYYRYDAQTSLRATMATARSVGASDSSLDTLGLMKDHFWELALDRTIDKNLAFSILYRYDSYRDNTEPGMSYRENQIMVILKSRN